MAHVLIIAVAIWLALNVAFVVLRLQLARPPGRRANFSGYQLREVPLKRPQLRQLR